MPTLKDLSTEIRLMIWEILLVSPTGALEMLPSKWADAREHPRVRPPLNFLFVTDNPCESVASGEWGTSDPTSQNFVEPQSISTSILRTCREFNMEANNLFWNQNTFVFSTVGDMKSYLKPIGICAAFRMKHIGIALRPMQGIMNHYIRDLSITMSFLKRFTQYAEISFHIDHDIMPEFLSILDWWRLGVDTEYDDLIRFLQWLGYRNRARIRPGLTFVSKPRQVYAGLDILPNIRHEFGKTDTRKALRDVAVAFRGDLYLDGDLIRGTDEIEGVWECSGPVGVIELQDGLSALDDAWTRERVVEVENDEDEKVEEEGDEEEDDDEEDEGSEWNEGDE